MKFYVSLILLNISILCMGQNKVDVLDLSNIDLESETVNLDEVKKPASQTQELKVEEIVEPDSEYRYASFGKEDPFAKPSLKSSSNNTTAVGGPLGVGSEIPMISPLQAFPLDQLAVKGVWVLPNGEARAVIMTPKKEGVIVKNEDPISAGKVLDIRRDRILVRQYKLRTDGSRTFTDIEIPIGERRPQQLGTIKLTPGRSPTFERIKNKRLDIKQTTPTTNASPKKNTKQVSGSDEALNQKLIKNKK